MGYGLTNSITQMKIPNSIWVIFYWKSCQEDKQNVIKKKANTPVGKPSTNNLSGPGLNSKIRLRTYLAAQMLTS